MNSPSFKEKVGKRIKKIREEKNLTQAQLGKRAGININYIAVIERGEVTTSSEKLQKIANSLGVDISEITS